MDGDSILPNLMKGQKRGREEDGAKPGPGVAQTRVSSLLTSLVSQWEKKDKPAPTPTPQASTSSAKQTDAVAQKPSSVPKTKEQKKIVEEPKKKQSTDKLSSTIKAQEVVPSLAFDDPFHEGEPPLKRFKTESHRLAFLEVAKSGYDDPQETEPSSKDKTTFKQCSVDDFPLLSSLKRSPSSSSSSSKRSGEKTNNSTDPITIPPHPLMPFFEETLLTLAANYHHPKNPDTTIRQAKDGALSTPAAETLKPLDLSNPKSRTLKSRSKKPKKHNDLAELNLQRLEGALGGTRATGNAISQQKASIGVLQINPQNRPCLPQHHILIATNIPTATQYLEAFRICNHESHKRQKMMGPTPTFSLN